MKRAFDLLDEPRHIVQGKPRPEIPAIAGGDPEGLPFGEGTPAREPAAQRLVDDLAKGCFRLELGRHIVIRGERRSHVMMLRHTRHDAKRGRGIGRNSARFMLFEETVSSPVRRADGFWAISGSGVW
jgi:hypothetical protein